MVISSRSWTIVVVLLILFAMALVVVIFSQVSESAKEREYFGGQIAYMEEDFLYRLTQMEEQRIKERSDFLDRLMARDLHEVKMAQTVGVNEKKIISRAENTRKKMAEAPIGEVKSDG